ncbi:hypothetical protein NPIL_340481 [Nephila pilipes]|uniref:Uncharacterized protein n=1 Tax=Nephila pilipes TaxID=299642 RepID=A0A8X6NKJ3_NEPPI|nr:hypothetical protein NPIL_340481 [Nephila pilipes]
MSREKEGELVGVTFFNLRVLSPPGKQKRKPDGGIDCRIHSMPEELRDPHVRMRYLLFHLHTFGPYENGDYYVKSEFIAS